MTHSSPDGALADRIADHVSTLASTKMQMSLVIWDRMSRDFLEAVKLLRAPARGAGKISEYRRGYSAGVHARMDAEKVERTDAQPQAASCAEDCARIAEGHVGAYSYKAIRQSASDLADEACRDIAKAIRDAGPSQSQTPCAQQTDGVLVAAKLVLDTFEKDEAQGFRSRDRQFAIDILNRALSRSERGGQ